MDRKLLTRIASEIDTVCRLRQKKDVDVVRQLLEWLDYEFHGVVPLFAESDNASAVLPDTKKPKGRGLEE